MKKSQLIEDLAIIKGYALAADEISDTCRDSYRESLVSMIEDLLKDVNTRIIEDIESDE